MRRGNTLQFWRFLPNNKKVDCHEEFRREKSPYRPDRKPFDPPRFARFRANHNRRGPHRHPVKIKLEPRHTRGARAAIEFHERTPLPGVRYVAWDATTLEGGEPCRPTT